MQYTIRKLHPPATKRIWFNGANIHSLCRNLAETAPTSESKISKMVGLNRSHGGAKPDSHAEAQQTNNNDVLVCGNESLDLY